MKATLGLLLALAQAMPALAQGTDPVTRGLSLQQAIEAALAGNAELAIAEANRGIASSQGGRASRRLWPRLDLQGGYVRSNDPVFAFGTKLQQERFAAEDLDLEVLNRPDPVVDWPLTVGLRWSLLDPKVWSGRASAKSRAQAAAWSTVRTREATVLLTRLLYYRAQSAGAQLDAALAAVKASEATLESFRRRNERGLLTDADLLQAEAELAAARAELAEAERARTDARQQLGLHLGWGPDTIPEPTDTLLPPQTLPEGAFHPEARADLRALAAAVEAAGSAKTQATLAYIPALDVVAQYSTHSTDPLSFDGQNWTVGLMLRWTLFDGFGRLSDSERASLEQRIATIEYEQARRDAASERARAERAVRSARLQVEATRAASEAAGSGRTLMRRRFEEGLATAADLLQAEARATAMRQRAIDALAGYRMAVAQLEFVRSQSNSESEL